MERVIFQDEHAQFRAMAKAFMEREVTPFHEKWEAEGIVSRDVWLAAGAAGLLGMDVPEEFGGGGSPDFRYQAILDEEMAGCGATGPGFALQNDVMAPYLLRLCDADQRGRWLPGFCSGELISAIAMTEPDTGSDLKGIRTRATRDGSDWILNGQKTFITNGILADFVVVVVRTDDGTGSRQFSLLVVERGAAGFERGRNLAKTGMHAQDTAELSFTDVRVPAENLLGDEGRGFVYLMENLPRERLSIAVTATAAAEYVLGMTTEYCRSRKAFGQRIGDFQNTRFVLAECATQIAVTRAFVDQSITALNEASLSPTDAAMAKWWSTEMLNTVVGRCVQLHGGYGYMSEYPIAKAFIDAKVSTIFGGTTEIMKEIIGRQVVGIEQ
jgi:alkylation response protein AidB-like acyl-CoA dehydrogenase